MTNPYYRITVSARVRIRPEGLDNNIDENIKNEVIDNYNNKCYNDYGYIDGIYKIADIGNRGVIQREDPTSSGLYTVDIVCRMLVPIPQHLIYSHITGINERMIVAKTGQMTIMIYENNINKNNIKYIKSAYYPINSDGKVIGEPIVSGMPVIIRILASRVVPRQPNMMALGMLESVVPPSDYSKIYDKMDDIDIAVSEIELIRGRSILNENIFTNVAK